jgi:hypothetical protein
MIENPPPIPSNLGERGAALWESIASKFELRPDELAILLDACREADLIERIQDEMMFAPLISRGSMGQEVASPFVSEIRQHRTVLAGLLGKIKVPESSEVSARKKAAVSDSARKAARARWGTGAGTG